MSTPARSAIWNGPIGMPNSTWTRSICSGVAPSSSSLFASTWRGISMRLPMKPWQTPATTATFLIFLASCIAVTSTSGAVFAPRTTSSSFITLAGEKKCRPSTSCGREVDGRDLVDVEIGGVGGEDRARLGDLVELAENLLLDVHILEHRLDDQVAIGEVVEARASASAAPSRPRPARRSSGPWRRSPRNSCASRRCRGRAPPAAISTIVTGMPALRKFIEMPPPIVPAPITPTRLISRGCVSSGRPSILAALRSAKKKYCWAARLGAGHQLHEQPPLVRARLRHRAWRPPPRSP